MIRVRTSAQSAATPAVGRAGRVIALRRLKFTSTDLSSSSQAGEMFGQSTTRRNALGALLVFACAFVLHIDNLDNELLGWDTYATIIASRIESWADLWGTFSEVMMDGRLPFGDFYRPVGNLFIALDYAIWDLEPFGYQLTNLALWSLSASLVYLLARRLIGHGAILAPIVA